MRVIEIGSIESLGDKPGIVIEATEEELKSLPNILYQKVQIGVIPNEEESYCPECKRAAENCDCPNLDAEPMGSW